MKVLLIPNYARKDAVAGARSLAEWLDGQGVEVQWAHDKKLYPDKVVDTTGVGLAVSFGGDGTLLRAAKIVGYSEIPLVGISYGHLGFLTCAGPDDVIETVSDALGHRMHASHRATLDITVDFKAPDGTIFSKRRFALNDLSLTHGVRGDMIVFDVAVSGHHVDTLRGDGFVVATATGSTESGMVSRTWVGCNSAPCLWEDGSSVCSKCITFGRRYTLQGSPRIEGSGPLYAVGRHPGK